MGKIKFKFELSPARVMFPQMLNHVINSMLTSLT